MSYFRKEDLNIINFKFNGSSTYLWVRTKKELKKILHGVAIRSVVYYNDYLPLYMQKIINNHNGTLASK